MGPLLPTPSWLMAAGRVLLRVRSHSGPCLDLLQSGIVRTSSRPLKGPAAVARPPSCVVAISICLFRHQVVNCHISARCVPQRTYTVALTAPFTSGSQS